MSYETQGVLSFDRIRTTLRSLLDHTRHRAMRVNGGGRVDAKLECGQRSLKCFRVQVVRISFLGKDTSRPSL